MFAWGHISFKKQKKKEFSEYFHKWIPDLCSFPNLAKLHQINKLKIMEKSGRTMRQSCFSHSTGCTSPGSGQPCALTVTARQGQAAFQRHPPVYSSPWTCRDKWNYLDLLQCLGFIILTSFHTPIVVVWVMSRSLWAALCFTPGFWCAKFRELWNDNALIR